MEDFATTSDVISIQLYNPMWVLFNVVNMYVIINFLTVTYFIFNI